MTKLEALSEAISTVASESKALGLEKNQSFIFLHSVLLTTIKLQDELICFTEGTLPARELRRKLVSSVRPKTRYA